MKTPHKQLLSKKERKQAERIERALARANRYAVRKSDSQTAVADAFRSALSH